MLIYIISCCPILKSFTLFGMIKNVHIEDEKHFRGSEYSVLARLFQLLPLIEHLEMNCCAVKCFASGDIPGSLPNTLVHLRDELRFVLLLVASSPNLKKVKNGGKIIHIPQLILF
ncbi:hypothetical protein HanIR_Chr17g0865841 [Helianthus annuus]|nr:hypothetical protein HanIR_Chr17g0865841 [Helianthus annuus]